jgi:hypothetical protein
MRSTARCVRACRNVFGLNPISARICVSSSPLEA